jgi:hypothetical protein
MSAYSQDLPFDPAGWDPFTESQAAIHVPREFSKQIANNQMVQVNAIRFHADIKIGHEAVLNQWALGCGVLRFESLLSSSL